MAAASALYPGGVNSGSSVPFPHPAMAAQYGAQNNYSSSQSLTGLPPSAFQAGPWLGSASPPTGFSGQALPPLLQLGFQGQPAAPPSPLQQHLPPSPQHPGGGQQSSQQMGNGLQTAHPSYTTGPGSGGIWAGGGASPFVFEASPPEDCSGNVQRPPWQQVAAPLPQFNGPIGWQPVLSNRHRMLDYESLQGESLFSAPLPNPLERPSSQEPSGLNSMLLPEEVEYSSPPAGSQTGSCPQPSLGGGSCHQPPLGGENPGPCASAALNNSDSGTATPGLPAVTGTPCGNLGGSHGDPCAARQKSRSDSPVRPRGLSGVGGEQLTPSRDMLLATCGQRPGNEQLPFAGLQEGFQSAWSIFINSFEAMSGGWCSHQATNASSTGLGSFHTQLEFRTPHMAPEKLSWYAQTVPPTEASAQRGGTVSPITGFCAEGFGDPCREVDAGHAAGLVIPAHHSSLNMMPPGPDRRLSLQTATSRGTADRAMSQAEACQSLASSSCSLHSLKGNKTTSPNQDRAMAAVLCRGGCGNSETTGATDLLAVFDGHGEGGHWVSETCCEVLPKLLLRRLAQANTAQAAGSGGQVGGAHCVSPTARNPQEADGRSGTEWWREAAIQAFEDMHAILETSTAKVMAREEQDEQLALEGEPQENGILELSACGQPAIDARTSGTTATVLLLLPSRRLLAAHVGDSRAVFGTRRRGPDRAAWRAIELTRDHKPDLPDERQRIEDAGAQVVLVGCPPHSTHRVFTPHQSWPSINMSRSLGDLHAHTQGLASAAEANLVEQLWDPGMEEAVIILGSDGIWDVLDGLAAVELAAHAREQGNDPAAILSLEAYDRWNKRGLQGGYTDDITVIVKFL